MICWEGNRGGVGKDPSGRGQGMRLGLCLGAKGLAAHPALCLTTVLAGLLLPMLSHAFMMFYSNSFLV